VVKPNRADAEIYISGKAQPSFMPGSANGEMPLRNFMFYINLQNADKKLFEHEPSLAVSM